MKPWYVPLDGSTLPSRDEIGGKAWSLARMRRLGLPCPPAFALPTHVSHAHDCMSEALRPEVHEALRAGISYLEQETARSFGSGPRPLLVSVRSGAPVSMPGMMDTVLNLGIDDRVEGALAQETLDADYARDVHRRFLLGYGRIVLKADLDDESGSVAELRERVRAETAVDVPQDPWIQLHDAVRAVLESWNSRRARAYRKHMGISDDLGTAVTVQAMVFGNVDANSGTGVLFTRDPLAGSPQPFGEYLPCGQGEDVVSGERTPMPLSCLAERLPDVHAELLRAGRLLEREGRDVQDIEFTVERGRLYLLQSRAAKRAPEAAVRLAVAFADEGLISSDEALARVTADQVRQVLRPRLEDTVRSQATVVATGEAACPGAVAGVALSDADDVVARAAAGESVVFLAVTTSPEDVAAMIAAAAVVTETGGSTSHAAVVCRGLGRPAVVGCGDGVVTALEGSEVTVEGGTGEVFAGALPLRTLQATDDDDLAKLEQWAVARSPITVVAKADAPAGTVDLDEQSVVEVAAIAEATEGATAATGVVLETNEGVAAAVRCGLATLVTDRSLPVLLSACAAARAVRDVVPPTGPGSTSERAPDVARRPGSPRDVVAQGVR